MSNLQVYLFGPPRLEIDGQIIKIERRKAAALVAYLALNEAHQSRDILAALLWSESDHNQARAALRSTLSTLTRITDYPWIEADRDTIALKRDAVWVDVIAFNGVLRQAINHSHSRNDLCDECAALFQQASAIYRDDFMHGFYVVDSIEFEHWQMHQRDWLRREYIGIQRRLSFYFSECGQSELAIRYAHGWLACDPLQESAYRQLMRLYAANGQRTEALRQYQQCVDRLDAELATPPETETIRLYESLLQHQTETSTGAAQMTRHRPIGVMPALPTLIVGREDNLEEIKRRLGMRETAPNPVTVIHGWPGVGKSTTMAAMTHDAEIGQHFTDGILWTSLGETPNLLNELTGWANALGIAVRSEMHKLDELTAQIIATIRDKRLLLVIDDVWQTDHARPFRVGGGGCVTVMTSRLFDVAVALAPTAADVYRLPVLSEAAGLQLLSQLTPETVQHHPDEARELVRDLEGLPLALNVAGRLLHTESKMGWGIRELLTKLHDGVRLLAAAPPADVMVTSPTVAALLNRSTDLLDPETRRNYALLGLFAPKPATFHLEAMAVAWDIDDPRPTARRLVQHGLLEPASGGRFQMHALLVMHAQTLLQVEFGG